MDPDKDKDRMKIELLHIDDCPSAAKALEHVEAALVALGRNDVTVNLRHIKALTNRGL
jgi:hypothetical protein